MKKRKIAKMTGLLLAAVLLTGCFAGIMAAEIKTN